MLSHFGFVNKFLFLYAYHSSEIGLMVGKTIFDTKCAVLLDL